jgi:prepilin-type N-terminal cleavage/methylation domain-containing protein
MKMKIKLKKQKNQGMTIIELMIVLAIIGMMLGIIGFKIRESRNRRLAQTTAQQIKQALELARDYSLTGEVIAGLDLNNDGIEDVPPAFEVQLSPPGTPCPVTVNGQTTQTDRCIWIGYTHSTDPNKQFPEYTKIGLPDFNQNNMTLDFNNGDPVIFETPNGESGCNPECIITICGEQVAPINTCSPDQKYEISVNKNQIKIIE